MIVTNKALRSGVCGLISLGFGAAKVETILGGQSALVIAIFATENCAADDYGSSMNHMKAIARIAPLIAPHFRRRNSPPSPAQKHTDMAMMMIARVRVRSAGPVNVRSRANAAANRKSSRNRNDSEYLGRNRTGMLATCFFCVGIQSTKRQRLGQDILSWWPASFRRTGEQPNWRGSESATGQGDAARRRPSRRNQSSEVVRFVLWLTVVVALAVGWWLDRQQLVRTTIPISTAQELFSGVERLFEQQTGKDLAVQYKGIALTEHGNRP